MSDVIEKYEAALDAFDAAQKLVHSLAATVETFAEALDNPQGYHIVADENLVNHSVRTKPLNVSVYPSIEQVTAALNDVVAKNKAAMEAYDAIPSERVNKLGIGPPEWKWRKHPRA